MTETIAQQALASVFFMSAVSFHGAAGMSPILIPYDGLKAKGITLSKCQIWRLERQGKFPRRVPISPARHAWLESEIDAHVAALIAKRNAARPARPATAAECAA